MYTYIYIYLYIRIYMHVSLPWYHLISPAPVPDTICWMIDFKNKASTPFSTTNGPPNCQRVPKEVEIRPPLFESAIPPMMPQAILSETELHVYVQEYVYAYMYTYTCIRAHTHIYIYLFIYICKYTYIYAYICIYMYTHIYSYVHTHIYIYVYIFMAHGMWAEAGCRTFERPVHSWRNH